MAVGLAASVALSATYGAFVRPEPATGAMAPEGVTPESPEGRACALDLKSLRDELVERAGRTFVGDGGPTPDMLRDWTAWTATWRDRLLERRTACRLGESKAMAPVDRLARHLERLHLAYTTALNGFSDVGRRQLVETRKAFEALGVDGRSDVNRP
jgi:hypothetical protein